MTLLPLMQFIFDPSWPTAGATVFMTPTKVWGPLAVTLLLALFFAPFWIVLVGIFLTGIQLWIDPKYYETIEWDTKEWEEVMDDG